MRDHHCARCWARTPLIAVLVLGVCACESLGLGDKKESRPIGGDWVIERVTVHGPEAAHSNENLLRTSGGSTVFVDEDVLEYHFFAPDCMVWASNRVHRPMFVACGDRQPVRMPEWILEVRETGLWGGAYRRQQDGKTVDLYEMVPIDTVLRLARQQPEFQRKWASAAAASTPAPIEKVFVVGKQ